MQARQGLPHHLVGSHLLRAELCSLSENISLRVGNGPSYQQSGTPRFCFRARFVGIDKLGLLTAQESCLHDSWADLLSVSTLLLHIAIYGVCPKNPLPRHKSVA